jgi:hypothetical protein
MTVAQLENVEKALSKQMPGWMVARGGILMEDTIETGIVVMNVVNKTMGKTIVFDFDNMQVAAMQG